MIENRWTVDIKELEIALFANVTRTRVHNGMPLVPNKPKLNSAMDHTNGMIIGH